MKIEANASTGSEVEQILKHVYSTPPVIVERARAIMN